MAVKEMDLRDWAIGEVEETVDPGFVPLTWIPISRLRDHRKFQRAIRLKRVERYRDRFDPRLFGAIAVARYPDGTLSGGPIEGMHRIEALAALYPGKEMLVPCFVVDVRDEREEAELFEELNAERVRIDNADLFRSRLFREEAQAVAVVEVVRRSGWDIDPGVHHASWNTLIRGQAALRIYRVSPMMLEDTLRLAADLWPNQIETRQESTLLGVCHLISDYSKQRAWDRDRIVEVLGDISLKTIMRMVKVTSSGSKKKKGAAAADTFVTVYNENKDRDWPRFRLVDREGRNEPV